jgi:hypothetical protein
MSEQSEQINELASALAKAQGKITGALKDSANPFFKSKYADLAACWDSCRLPLSENGLSVIQVPAADDQGVILTTILAHSSGQWIKSVLRMVPKDGSPQSVGSALTYARRYALAAMVGLAQVDDDGNAASGKESEPEKKWTRQDTAKSNAYAKRIVEAVSEGRDVLEIWGECSEDHEFASAVWAVLPNPVKDFIKSEKTKRG